MDLEAFDCLGATLCWAEGGMNVQGSTFARPEEHRDDNLGGESNEKNMDLAHEDLSTRVHTGSDRVIKRIFETFLFAYDTVQKVCAIDMRGL